MAALISRCCASLSKLWNADDSGAVWRTGVAGGWANRHAAGHERTGSAGRKLSGAIPMPVISTWGNLIKIAWYDGIGMSLSNVLCQGRRRGLSFRRSFLRGVGIG
jgi:hypothetical protein